MKVDLRRFFRACNPSKVLRVESAEDRKYYIDFSKVRGAEIIEELGQTIVLMSPDPTCQLFTGHIGCGKSTELLRLKAELEKQGFHVVYFESSQDLDMGDVDLSDILLAIARQVKESLTAIKISLESKYFTNLFKEFVQLLKTPINLDSGELELSWGIGKITLKAKESPQVRNQLRQYLEPRTENLLKAINDELLEPAKLKLAEQGSIQEAIDCLEKATEETKPESNPKVYIRLLSELRSLYYEQLSESGQHHLKSRRERDWHKRGKSKRRSLLTNRHNN